MPTIGVIDDRKTQRRQLVRAIETSEALPDGWNTFDSNPLAQVSSYPDWILENDIATLVLDERLQEQQADVEVHVDYNGHDVVDHIRKSLPTFPIFIVTAAPEDPDLAERFADVEGIIPRDDFVKDSDQLVPRFVRCGQRFFQSNEEQFARFEVLASLVAQDKASDDEINELNALRAHFQLPYEDQIQTPDKWIEEFEANVADLRSLEKRIATYIGEMKLNPESES